MVLNELERVFILYSFKTLIRSGSGNIFTIKKTSSSLLNSLNDLANLITFSPLSPIAVPNTRFRFFWSLEASLLFIPFSISQFNGRFGFLYGSVLSNFLHSPNISLPSDINFSIFDGFLNSSLLYSWWAKFSSLLIILSVPPK